MSSPPTGTVTFLFTDIAGSTNLTQAHLAEWENARQRHHAILRRAVEAHQGYVFQIIGDAFCVAFPTALAALSAAVAAQRAIQAEVWGETLIKVRMGLHTGAADLQNDDYEGYVTLARVQRIMSVGYGGQVLLSRTSAELLVNDLPADVSLRDLGEHRLKDLRRREHLYQLVSAVLPVDFPPLRSLDTLPNNLPTQLTSFIGREREVAEVKALISANRLLTLTGPGGTGKTRLSLQVGAELLQTFQDGVWLVELAPLVDPALIPQTVAAAVGIREQPGRPVLDTLADYLRAKQMLLILDNCEHLIEASARVADGLLRACPRLTILTSSRETLGIPGETSYRVPSLSLPGPQAPSSAEAVLEYDCVRLFVDRALAVQPHFRLTEKNAQAIVQICARLDGIPLAVELAASRLRIFSVEQIAVRLDDRFRLLTGGGRTALPRQQTLRALIDWSYELLSETEQALLRRFSVFAGGWTFEAAEALSPEADVLTLLMQLVNKSLVMVDDGEARYRLLETVRQYAREKLLESGDAAHTRHRHLDYFPLLAEQSELEVFGPDVLTWLDRLEIEHDNLRVAMEWALESQPEMALRLVGALGGLWSGRSHMTEARAWGQSALTRADMMPAVEGDAARTRARGRAKALSTMAWAAITQGDHRAGLAAAGEGVTLAREAGDLGLLARLLSTLGLAAVFLGDPTLALASARESEAIGRQMGYKAELAMALATLANIGTVSGSDESEIRPHLEEATALGGELGYPGVSAFSVINLARFAGKRGDLVTARLKTEEAVAIFRKWGDRRLANTVRSELAHILRRHGDFEGALVIYQETILIWQELGHRAAVAHELECFAFIAIAQGRAQRAARLMGAAESLREAIGTPMTSEEKVEYDRTLAAIHAQVDEKTLSAIWDTGKLMTLEQAIALALRDDL